MKVVDPYDDNRPLNFTEYISMAYRNKNKNKGQSQEPTHEYFSASGMEHFYKVKRMGENQVKGKSKGTFNDKVGKLTADTLINAKESQGRPLFYFIF